MNRGGLGARTLNVALQAALNPATGQPQVERFGWTYRPGDKVMQTAKGAWQSVGDDQAALARTGT